LLGHLAWNPRSASASFSVYLIDVKMIVQARFLLPAIFVLSNFFAWCEASWDDPFEEFYPDYNAGFQQIIRNNCSEQYANFKAATSDDAPISEELQAFGMHSPKYDVSNCILGSTPEFVKSKMQSAQVLLGLMPTILATLGTGPQETGTLAIVGRRPILSFILAMGSPAVFAIRSFEYVKGVEDLRKRPLHRSGFARALDVLNTVAAYVLALASVANIAELSWELGARVIFTTLADIEYLIVIWMFVGIVIHALGALAVRMRVTVKPSGSEEHFDASGTSFRRHRPHVRLAASQFKPLARQNTELNIEVWEESELFFVLTWFTSILSAAHIIFGTMVFSSALFISVKDTLIVMARLMASVIVCRIILTHELSILRGLVKVKYVYRRSKEKSFGLNRQERTSLEFQDTDVA
jgi:hypothetical protein